MSEIGNISVSINGDASGILSAASSAQSAITSLSSAAAGLKSQNVSLTIAAVDNASPVIAAASANVTAFGALSPKATITAADNTASGVASAQAAVNSIQDRTVNITVRVKQEGSIPNFAAGTMSAPQGLAKINDEKGVSDPRELIYHDGNYYIFEGQDILLPLDRGDKVFTAAQTKNIMRLNGVESYASGKNNELFESDKKVFRSTVKSSNVPIAEQIDWWKSAIEEYAYDSEVVMECSEEIFSLTRKLVKELNSVSGIYVEERDLLNNWSEFGDTAIDAFNRVRDRNFEFVQQGIITWEEYCENVGKIGANMYKERIDYSENWLKQQYKYNDLSVEDYIAGIERMAEYTKEYYENGLIGDVDYFYGMQSISNKKSDMQDVMEKNLQKENDAEYKAWKKSADGWKKQRETYGDWEEFGDSLSQYYERCIERQREFFSAGKIDWETYNDAIINYRLEMYKAEQKEAESIYKQMISSAKDYISEIKDNFAAQKGEIDYEFKTERLNREFLKASNTRAIYSNAVTQRGKDAYEDADEKLDSIAYERSSLILEKEQSAALKALESSYKRIEDNKTVIMGKIMDGSFDISGILSDASIEFSRGQENVCVLLNELINTVKSNTGGTVYGSTTYNITGADSSFVGPILQRGASALAYGYGG